MATATPTKSITQMQQDLLKYRASKLGTPDPTAPVAAPATTTPDQTASDTTNEAIGASLAAYKKDKAAGKTTTPEVPKDPNALAEFAKSIFSAPATIVARPFQAVAELAGAKDEDVNKFSHDISGGLIAPTPQNYGDVGKDVGRAAETVALGTGAPIAGGALFGVGASLEQGNDLLSAQTLADAAIGGAGGKVLEWVGKPLLNAAGKVVGTITPKIIKDAAAGGAESLAKFAATHDLPLGISTVTKPIANGIQKGTQAVDDAIGAGFKKGGAALQKTAAEQFPGLNPVTHFTNAAERDLVKPTTLNDSKFAKATAIFQDAKSKGIDLEKHATANGIFHDDLTGEGKFNTKDAEQSLRDSVYKDGNDVIRPALKDIEPGVRLVPITEVRQAMLNRIDAIPPAKASAEAKAAMRKTIERTYSDGSERAAAIDKINGDATLSPQVKAAQIREAKSQFPEASAESRAHPNGYSLTNLHDARIERGANGKYVPGISTEPAIVKAKLARQQEQVFRTLFDNNVPSRVTIGGQIVENPLKGVRREFQKNLMLADYLKALNGKKVPEGAAKKAVRLFGRAAAATVGGKIGGFPGAILGSQYGDMLFASFESLDNPLKRVVLSRLQAEKSPAFDVLAKYLHQTKQDALLMKLLPAGGESSYKAVAPTLFSTPKGFASPSLQEAVDVGNVETGKIKKPGTDRRLKSYLTKAKTAEEAKTEPYQTPGSLPVIRAGNKPKPAKKLTDIYID